MCIPAKQESMLPRLLCTECVSAYVCMHLCVFVCVCAAVLKGLPCACVCVCGCLPSQVDVIFPARLLRIRWDLPSSTPDQYSIAKLEFKFKHIQDFIQLTHNPGVFPSERGLLITLRQAPRLQW